MENSKAFVSLLISEPVYIIQNKQIEPSISLSNEPSPNEFSNSNVAQHIPNKELEVKKVIIYCDQKNASDLSFLSKILLAVNISEKEAHVTTFSSSDEQLASDKHIYFGTNTVSPKGPLYELFKSEDKQILLADALTEIQKDVNKKKSLWSALQKMFL